MGQLDGIQGKRKPGTEPEEEEKEGGKRENGKPKEGGGVHKDVKGHVDTAGKGLNGVADKVGGTAR